jgi:hypothetical protein
MSKTLKRLAEKHPDKIESVDHDSDGYWIYLRDGWLTGEPSHTIHEDTVKDCLIEFRGIRYDEADAKNPG